MMFDEINKLEKEEVSKSKVLDFETYFGEMGISEKDKQKRIALANDIQSAVLFLFYLISISKEYNNFDEDMIRTQFLNRFRSAVLAHIILDDYLYNYLNDMATSILDVTLAHVLVAKATENIADNYYLSNDRATFIAEDESNTFYNYDEFVKAKSLGNTHKTWHTMKDKKVRKTHAILEGKRLPIDDYYIVGNSLMRFPKDTENADASDYVNCRCWITYS